MALGSGAEEAGPQLAKLFRVEVARGQGGGPGTVSHGAAAGAA